MEGGVETTEGVGWKKADSQRPGERARRREEIGRGKKARRREDRENERPRDSERDCEHQERDRKSALSPEAGSPRKAQLHEAAEITTRSHRAPGASGRRLQKPEAGSPALAWQAGDAVWKEAVRNY